MSTDRILTYAIGISVAAHLVVVSIVGATSGDRLGAASTPQAPTALRVELVRDPLEEPKPQPVPEAPKQPDAPRPIDRSRVSEQPTIPNAKPAKPVESSGKSRPQPTGVRRVPQSSVSPGGKLNTGSASAQGDLPGNWAGGTTPVGWVPGSETGKGSGSGSGRGVGTPEPPRQTVPQPVTRPSQESPSVPRPVPQPAPKVVHTPKPETKKVTVCSASGLLPGKHCTRTESRSFIAGSEPGRTCSLCKPPPEPPSSPVLVRDTKLSTGSLDDGLRLRVQVEYTVTVDGQVTDVKVIKSSGNRSADNAVVKAASGLKYKPAIQNGAPRSVKMTRTYDIKT